MEDDFTNVPPKAATGHVAHAETNGRVKSPPPADGGRMSHRTSSREGRSSHRRKESLLSAPTSAVSDRGSIIMQIGHEECEHPIQDAFSAELEIARRALLDHVHSTMNILARRLRVAGDAQVALACEETRLRILSLMQEQHGTNGEVVQRLTVTHQVKHHKEKHPVDPHTKPELTEAWGDDGATVRQKTAKHDGLVQDFSAVDAQSQPSRPTSNRQPEPPEEGQLPIKSTSYTQITPIAPPEGVTASRPSVLANVCSAELAVRDLGLPTTNAARESLCLPSAPALVVPADKKTVIRPDKEKGTEASLEREDSEETSDSDSDTSTLDHADPTGSATYRKLQFQITQASGEMNLFVVLDAWKKSNTQLAAKLGGQQQISGLGSQDIGMVDLGDDDSDSDECSEEGAISRDGGFWRHLVMHPNCVKRGVWEISSLFLVIYDIIWIPLQLLDPPETYFTELMGWVTRLFWTLDIIVSLVTGYVTSDGFIEMRFRPIIKRYAKTWLSLDVVVVGIDWLEILWEAARGGGYARIGRAARAFRIVRMVRLLRLLRIKDIVQVLFEYVRSESLKEMSAMIKIVALMLLSGHLVACFWYGLGVSEVSPHSWVMDSFSNWHSLGYRYATSLHWSLAQFSGGMDDIPPVNLVERTFAIVVFLYALMVGAILVSSLTSSMTQLNLLANERVTKLSMLRKYLQQNGVSYRLTLRVQRNAQHALLEQQNFIPEAHVELLELVSEPLRIELHFELYARILKDHPFFEEYIMECPHILQKVCHSSTSIVGVSAGDIIFNVGEIPPKPKMIFVSNGSLLYNLPNPNRRHTVTGDKKSQRRSQAAPAPRMTLKADELCQGQWIAEPVLWTHWMHRGILRALVDSRLCLLDAHKFQDVVCTFDHDEFNPKVYASGFVDGLNNIKDALTDIARGVETRALDKLEAYMDKLGKAREAANTNVGKRRSRKRKSSIASGNSLARMWD